MTSENASNYRSSGRGRHRSTTPRSAQPSSGDTAPATELPPSGSAIESPSPRKRRAKSPLPETTPTRLRQTIAMTAGAPAGILGPRSRKTVPSPSSPESPFVSSPRDKTEGPDVSGDRAVPTMGVLSAPTVDNLEGGSSVESSVVSKQKGAPSVHGDGNRLTPTVLDVPSREASMPPILVNTGYGGAPPYYGGMQPLPPFIPSDVNYFPPHPPSPNPMSMPLGVVNAANPGQGPAHPPAQLIVCHIITADLMDTMQCITLEAPGQIFMLTPPTSKHRPSHPCSIWDLMTQWQLHQRQRQRRQILPSYLHISTSRGALLQQMPGPFSLGPGPSGRRRGPPVLRRQ